MSERMRRVDEAVKQVLSETIPTLNDPGIGFVTITDVKATQDLETAKVWVSVLGDEEARKRSLEALERARGVLQAAVNDALHIRRTPHLVFQFDPSVERGVRLSQLIDEVAPPPLEEEPVEEEAAADEPR